MVMRKYKLLIMPRAVSDLENIYDYIEQEHDAPAAAQKLMVKIENSFMRLRDMPESCPPCQDKILFQKGYRMLVIAGYIALYTVDNIKKTVTVMRVVHGRQDYTRFV